MSNKFNFRFLPVPYELLIKYNGGVESLVFARILSYELGVNHYCSASHETIAEQIGVSLRTVQRAVKTLKQDNYIYDVNTTPYNVEQQTRWYKVNQSMISVIDDKLSLFGDNLSEVNDKMSSTGDKMAYEENTNISLKDNIKDININTSSGDKMSSTDHGQIDYDAKLKKEWHKFKDVYNAWATSDRKTEATNFEFTPVMKIFCLAKDIKIKNINAELNVHGKDITLTIHGKESDNKNLLLEKETIQEWIDYKTSNKVLVNIELQ